MCILHPTVNLATYHLAIPSYPRTLQDPKAPPETSPQDKISKRN